MPNNMSLIVYHCNRCQATTKKGTQCKFKGVFSINGVYKCGKHIPKNERQSETFDICEDDQCNICYEPLYKNELVVTNCNHCFHEACLAKWKQTPSGNTCPMCRTRTNALRQGKRIKLQLQIAGKMETFMLGAKKC